MSKTIIFGASGFMGQNLIQNINLDKSILITRSLQSNSSIQNNRHWVEANLLNFSSLQKILDSGDTVINLAYSQTSPAEDNIKMAENLVKACIQNNISRIVHCSTAVVVGNNSSPFINEDTACLPVTEYEKTKYKIEKIFLDASNYLKVYILRPTEVIGPGGKNLKKMLSNLKYGNILINFVRSSLNRSRKLNLVPVRDVANALIYLSEQNSLSAGIYICSADDDFNNKYNCVEEIIQKLLPKRLRIKPIKLPNHFLKALLYISRSGSGQFINRTYSSEKFYQIGFHRSESILQAVRDFVLSEQA